MSAALLSAGLVVSLSVAEAPPSAAAASPKRGVASRVYLLTDRAKLTAAGARWSYAWTWNVPATSKSLGVVPMVFGKSVANSKSDMAVLTKGHASGKYRYLLGFNEPDESGQSNLTPTQAADLWPKLVHTHLILGSPAVANPADSWLKSFIHLVHQRHMRLNFIALHFYVRIDQTAAGLARIKKQLASIHSQFGKPIWVTELGLVDRRKNPGPAAKNWARAEQFLKSVDKLLVGLPYVQHYAWMTDDVTKHPDLKWSALFDAKGHLTPLGVTYSKL